MIAGKRREIRGRGRVHREKRHLSVKMISYRGVRAQAKKAYRFVNQTITNPFAPRRIEKGRIDKIGKTSMQTFGRIRLTENVKRGYEQIRFVGMAGRALWSCLIR
jgi:hypothetical protein